MASRRARPSRTFKDVGGETVRAGDSVRVLGIPDLSRMGARERRESLPVFEHIVGTYRRVAGFNRLGWAELVFRVRAGPNAGLHTVWLETQLLRVRSRGRKSAR